MTAPRSAPPPGDRSVDSRGGRPAFVRLPLSPRRTRTDTANRIHASPSAPRQAPLLLLANSLPPTAACVPVGPPCGSPRISVSSAAVWFAGVAAGPSVLVGIDDLVFLMHVYVCGRSSMAMAWTFECMHCTVHGRPPRRCTRWVGRLRWWCMHPSSMPCRNEGGGSWGTDHGNSGLQLCTENED